MAALLPPNTLLGILLYLTLTMREVWDGSTTGSSFRLYADRLNGDAGGGNRDKYCTSTEIIGVLWLYVLPP